MVRFHSVCSKEFPNGKQVQFTAAEETQRDEEEAHQAIINPQTLVAIKAKAIINLKKKCKTFLSQTDWYLVRSIDGKAVPQSVKDKRTALRSKMEQGEIDVNTMNDIDDVRDYKIDW